MAYQPIAAGTTPAADDWNGFLLPGVLLFRASQNTGQSIPTRSAESVSDAIVWDTIDLDRLGGWSSLSPTKYTAQVAGWHTLAGSVGYNPATGTSGTFREAIWFINGALAVGGRATPHMSTAIAATPLTAEARTVPFLMAVGDTAQLVALQNSGGAIITAAGSLRSYMSVTYSGPA